MPTVLWISMLGSIGRLSWRRYDCLSGAARYEEACLTVTQRKDGRKDTRRHIRRNGGKCAPLSCCIPNGFRDHGVTTISVSALFS